MHQLFQLQGRSYLHSVRSAHTNVYLDLGHPKGSRAVETCEVGRVGRYNTGLFISPSGISELDCATTKTDTAERTISIGREPLQVLFVLGALAYFQVPLLRGSREEKWRSQ